MNIKVVHSLMLAAMLISGSTLAAPVSNGGIIHFTGTVVEEPCVITQNTADQIVDLGSVASRELAAKNDISIKVPFNIILEKCDTTTIKSATFAFTAVSSPYEVTALLNNGDADKVGVQITDASGAIVPLNATPTAYSLALTAGSQNIAKFTAHMIATGTGVTAGSVDTQVTFKIAYS